VGVGTGRLEVDEPDVEEPEVDGVGLVELYGLEELEKERFPLE
jgi:hypothetical protein